MGREFVATRERLPMSAHTLAPPLDARGPLNGRDPTLARFVDPCAPSVPSAVPEPSIGSFSIVRTAPALEAAGSALLSVPAEAPRLAYLDVALGTRPARDLLAQAGRALRLPGISGVALDRVPPSSGGGEWNLDIPPRALRTLGARTIALMPSHGPERIHAAFADIVCVARMPWNDLVMWRPPWWTRNLDPSQVWMMIHSVPNNARGVVLRLCQGRGAGNTWITASSGANPWGVGRWQRST